MGVFVSAKAAAELYLNGHRLGQNGRPAMTRADETPGLMDAVFHAPPSTLRSGPNVIAIRMSSHHGFLRFGFPVHYIGIDEYAHPTRMLLARSWPSLIPFGALLAGVLSFGAASIASGWRRQDILLGLLSLFAAGQLFVELYRSVAAYAYPAHEWRMILVALFSLGFGVCLATQVFWTFLGARRFLLLSLVAVATVAMMLSFEGYDVKAGVAILVPSVASAMVAAWAAIRGQQQARLYFGALAVFVGSIFAFTFLFLDTIFFFEVAGLVLVLFAMQTAARERERVELAEERARSRQLADALERASIESTPVTLHVSSAGAIDVIDASTIVFCKGAGDYVELHLMDGRQVLYGSALARIEDELPAGFLRVHRSFLVNTQFVRSLRRQASGTGSLILKDGTEVPVSRRVMPKVRGALTG